MATITIELNEDRLAKFKEPAIDLGVPPEELARISVEEFLDRPDEEYDTIIDEILLEHGELLKRLAR